VASVATYAERDAMAWPDEVDAVLPGDELASAVTPRTTRGATIDAASIRSRRTRRW